MSVPHRLHVGGRGRAVWVTLNRYLGDLNSRRDHTKRLSGLVCSLRRRCTGREDSSYEYDTAGMQYSSGRKYNLAARVLNRDLSSTTIHVNSHRVPVARSGPRRGASGAPGETKLHDLVLARSEVILGGGTFNDFCRRFVFSVFNNYPPLPPI